MKKEVIASVSILLGASVGATAMKTYQNKKQLKSSETLQKMGQFYDLLVRWISIKQQGNSLSTYFLKNGYKTIALYGMKELGERLYDELKGSEIEIKYIIDKNAQAIYSDIDVVTPEEPLDKVDAIVVTAVYYFEEIEERLEGKVDCPIISLEDVIYEM